MNFNSNQTKLAQPFAEAPLSKDFPLHELLKDHEEGMKEIHPMSVKMPKQTKG